MFRCTGSNTVADKPSYTTGKTPGFFAKYDPALGQAATVPGWEHFQRMTEELAAVIEGAGLTLSETDDTQLRQAIAKMVIAAQQAVIINSVTFEGTVADGDAVYWDEANTRFAKALANGTATDLPVGIADVTNSKVYLSGECPLFTGLSPGGRYYLDGSTAGDITTTAPADQKQIGIAKSATTLWIEIDYNTLSDTPVGGIVAVQSNITGSAAPPVSNFIRLKSGLTGSGAYNENKLTSESVSGSAPAVVATAVINDVASPMNGQTVHLAEDESRFFRAGSPGTLLDDAFQGHWHELYTDYPLTSTPGGAQGFESSAGSAQSIKRVRAAITDGTNGTPRVANETRPRSIGVAIYMRIK